MSADRNDNGSGIGPDFDHAYILQRYGDGDSLDSIAGHFKRSAPWVRTRLARFPKDLEEAKKRREAVRGARLRRIEAVADKLVLTSLEAFGARAITDTEDLARVASIAGKYGERANLHEGKLTANVGVALPTMSPEEWRMFWKKASDVGTGLDPAAL